MRFHALIALTAFNLISLVSATCSIGLQSTQADVCAAACVVAAQCAIQCTGTSCICSSGCLCQMELCFECCYLDDGYDYCNSASEELLEQCDYYLNRDPAPTCSAFDNQNLTSLLTSSTFAPAVVSTVTAILRSSVSGITVPAGATSASNCAAALSSYGNAYAALGIPTSGVSATTRTGLGSTGAGGGFRSLSGYTSTARERTGTSGPTGTGTGTGPITSTNTRSTTSTSVVSTITTRNAGVKQAELQFAGVGLLLTGLMAVIWA